MIPDSVQVELSGRILGNLPVFKKLTHLMGMRDCKSKSEIEKEKCPLARELLRGLAICADPKLASSVALITDGRFSGASRGQVLMEIFSVRADCFFIPFFNDINYMIQR